MEDQERPATQPGDGPGEASITPGDAAAAQPGAQAVPTMGAQLRAAREARGMSLDQVSDETKIQARYLEAIENGDYGELPARTYALGFSRNYARVVGLNQNDVARGVREEMSGGESERDYHREKSFEPGDPARVPSRGLVFLSIVALVLLVVGGFTFYSTFFSPASEPGPIAARQQAAQRQAANAPAARAIAAAPSGPVVFTALMDDSWVKFYQADGTELMQKQMAKGESYTIPADATDPRVWTGRPYAFAITVGGKPVPKLSEQDEIVKDVPVTPQALVARGQAQSPPATPTPAT